MNDNLYIPAKTRERLAFPAQPGQRHTDIVKIAASLISRGLNAEEAFNFIRPSYGPDLPDSEIHGIIRWAFKPFGNGAVSQANRFNTRFPFPFKNNNARLNAPISLSPEKAVERYLKGFRCEEVDLWERSPIRLPENDKTDAETLLTALYAPNERLNIVSNFKTQNGKSHPWGNGITRTQKEWLFEMAQNGPPVCDAGAWIRLNPVNGNGISNTDIVAFRFLLLESDSVSLPLQIAFFARLKLPIAAIISSGGKSLHAWVKIETKSISDYQAIAAQIYSPLIDFGIDQANKNPSRLSRLPGVNRELGGINEKRQKLLYLNPEPAARKIIE